VHRCVSMVREYAGMVRIQSCGGLHVLSRASRAQARDRLASRRGAARMLAVAVSRAKLRRQRALPSHAAA